MTESKYPWERDALEVVRRQFPPHEPYRAWANFEFIEFLDKVEDELTTPSNQLVGDPTHAKPGDILPGGYEVIRKLGTGSTATAMLVRKENQEFVAKIAVDTDHNDRVRDEGEVLQKLNNPLVAGCHSILQFADRMAILLDKAGDKTMRKRLSEEGRLSLDLLHRFGEDLLEAVVLLERAGIAHRDIKPDNIGVAFGGRDGALHLVLFDFSLSRCSPENIRAGTPGYLDPSCPCESRLGGTCKPSVSRRASRCTRWPRAISQSGTTARPIRPSLEGIDSRNIYDVHDLVSGSLLKQALAEQQPKTAVIVGGGYLGLEMAEALHMRGLKITMVQRNPQVMSTLDPDMGEHP